MRRIHPRTALLVIGLLGASAAPGFAQDAADGPAVFEQACASCHVQGDDPRAPGLDVLRELAPEAVLTSLTTGKMFRQGSELSDAARRAVAGYVAGRPVGTPAPPSHVGLCTAEPAPLARTDLDAGWNGWGGSVTNTRYQPVEKGGLTAPMVPRLKLKWAFGFPGVNSVRAQPTVVGGRVFVASESGDVFALDAKTGCTYWSYHARAGIRTAVSVGPYTNADRSGHAAYFADEGAVAYAVDADTGEEIWTREVDDHPYAGATGSPTLYDGRLYVVTSGVGEEGQGGRPGYACCTFRGSVTALDADTGEVVWKSYSIVEEPRPRGASTEGVPLWGPAGGGIWAAPTVDARRDAIYVATGNGYADPAQPTTDAVLALDMETGRIRWSYQPVANDVWTGGCGRGNSNNPNCPEELGPDHDFSMPPVLTTGADGRDILVILQKSGMAYGVDPDDGSRVWQYRTSVGSGMGGQWGAAVDGSQAFFSVNGTRAPTPGGVRAVTLGTGEEVWSREASEKLCGDARGCSAAQGAAVTAVPGVVFSGSMDGGIRAYTSEDGTIIWQFDTNRDFDTVNGVPATGGAMDGPGAAVADGMLYIDSGYVSLIGRPGNVLLAFGVD